MEFDRDLRSIQEVRDLVARARAAQEEYAGFSQEKVDKLVQAIAQAFDVSPVEVMEHYADYFFEVWYTATVGPIEDEAGLRDIINELKPAHLDWAIRYRLEQLSTVYVGNLPRQGDLVIWKVDCRNDT